MKETKIEWAHHTLNFWWGCEKVSPACKHCYAETLNKIYGRGRAVWGKGGLRWLRDNAFSEAMKLNRISKASGGAQRIFVNSMSDTFEDHPQLEEHRAKALGRMEFFQDANWLLLTKRPENITRMVPPAWLDRWPAHIWVGTTVESQEFAELRVPELLKVPARVRFLSCEPLLGVLDVAKWLRPDPCVDHYDPVLSECVQWVISGGESGPGARSMDPDWARDLRDQCAEAGTAYFFKQWGGRDKKAAGRELDGRTWDEVPLNRN